MCRASFILSKDEELAESKIWKQDCEYCFLQEGDFRKCL